MENPSPDAYFRPYPEFFNDVFGPIMQPGSSSHTAGPCRLGFLAHSLLGEQPTAIQVVIPAKGSFAGTFGLMHEDQAMIAGALGLLPDDDRLFDAGGMAQASEIPYGFEFGEVTESSHPNAVKFILTGDHGRAVELVGDSTGGGMVLTRSVDGYPLQLRGDAYVLLVFDPVSVVTAAQVGQLGESLASKPGYLGQGACEASGRGVLHFFASCERPDPAGVRKLLVGAPGVRVVVMEPVLPVLARPERRPQLFRSMTEWRELATRRGLPLWEVAVQYEIDASAWARKQVIDYMRMVADTMHHQTRAAYEEGVVVPESPFKANLVASWQDHHVSPRRLTDDLTANILKWAIGAGAGIPGVRTVPGPMGSGGGYIYAALSAVKEAKAFGEDDLLRGLFIAAGIGAIAYSRTEPTGEVIGCTGECGICGAMAAAAITEMAGGTPEQVENAASLSLQAAMGMPCDPIPGGLGQPCRSRALAAACTAVVFADLALAGRDAVLPLHEAIDVADAIGRHLPAELLCTSQGGCAAAPEALKRATGYRAWYDSTVAGALDQRSGILDVQRPPGNLI